MAPPARRTLTSRPTDLFYFVFFLIHIPATLLIDCQALYPPAYVPDVIRALPAWYVAMSGDPLVGGAMGLLPVPERELVWFKTFLCLEAVFQLPTFFIGARGLWRGSRGIYPLLIIYGASTATTTLACLAVVMYTPTTTSATIASRTISITLEQRIMLLMSYVPFFLIPLYMAVEVGMRVRSLLAVGLKAARALKTL
ncbi:hypothetical protein FA95DRAFT_1493602 [Auriscalpium vulgare]|uniref:Uncharacterized protein n=1 Tax=Auriscalpium vulgare TaxID=40419 RepID=A0ACB8RRC4_9AGAM|nr:hypothetical protein FA95DRAFT_1493602 [Auriscalpium vulgare]